VGFPVRTSLLGFLCALGLVAHATAGPLDEARAAFKRHDYRTVVRIVRPLASQGNAQAQYELGAAYSLGMGVPHDDTMAAYWYKKAAEQDISAAQSNIGVMYAHGRGVVRDDHLALFWLRKAAERGSPQAYENLGSIYILSEPKDNFQSYIWYSLAVSAASGFLHDMSARGREKAAAELTPAQIDEATRLASQWAAQHPEVPDPPLF